MRFLNGINRYSPLMASQSCMMRDNMEIGTDHWRNTIGSGAGFVLITESRVQIL